MINISLLLILMNFPDSVFDEWLKKTKVATKDDIADFHESYQKLIIDQLEMEQKV